MRFDMRPKEASGSIPAHWAHWTAHSWGASLHHCQLAAAVATSGSLLEICKYLDRAPNCEPVVVTVWFGKLVPLKITGWSFAHHPFQTTTHYLDFTQFKQLQKGDPPSPQNIVQNIKSVLYLVFWFWISLGLVTPFVDLVSRIRTKGLCAALVWIHLTFSRGFTQFANYKNCKYLDQKIYKNDIVHILCS